jgi:hypothetical protein
MAVQFGYVLACYSLVLNLYFFEEDQIEEIVGYARDMSCPRIVSPRVRVS